MSRTLTNLGKLGLEKLSLPKFGRERHNWRKFAKNPLKFGRFEQIKLDIEVVQGSPELIGVPLPSFSKNH